MHLRLPSGPVRLRRLATVEPGVAYPVGMTPADAFKRLTESVNTFDADLGMTREELNDLGLRHWAQEGEDQGNPTGNHLWLFPSSFYAHIPAGFPIVTISFMREEFMPGQTDDDHRFGLLAYGVLGKVKE